MSSNKINWIKIFKDIDLKEPLILRASIIDNERDEIQFYDEGSFGIAIQFMRDFKKETKLLSYQDMLNYIIALTGKNIPAPASTENALFNQVIFKGESLFHEFLMQYKKELEESLGIVQKEAPDEKIKVFYGYQSHLKNEQINYLYNQMQGIYIDTTFENFKSIFRKEALSSSNCLIKWSKTNALLAYLIKKLFHSDNPFDVWVKAEKIFDKKNLRQSENSTHPKGHEEIDKIIKILYTTLQ